jgi:transposase, IS5 family
MAEVVCADRAAPKARPRTGPKELEPILRIYFVQQWFNLADPALEEARYHSATLLAKSTTPIRV